MLIILLLILNVHLYNNKIYFYFCLLNLSIRFWMLEEVKSNINELLLTKELNYSKVLHIFSLMESFYYRNKI